MHSQTRSEGVTGGESQDARRSQQYRRGDEQTCRPPRSRPRNDCRSARRVVRGKVIRLCRLRGSSERPQISLRRVHFGIPEGTDLVTTTARNCWPTADSRGQRPHEHGLHGRVLPGGGASVFRVELDNERAMPALRIAVGSQMQRRSPPRASTRLDRLIGLRQAQHVGVRQRCHEVELVRHRREPRIDLQAGTTRGALARWAGGAIHGDGDVPLARLATFRIGRRARETLAARIRGCHFWHGSAAVRASERHRLAAAQRRPKADEQGNQDAEQRMTHLRKNRIPRRTNRAHW